MSHVVVTTLLRSREAQARIGSNMLKKIGQGSFELKLSHYRLHF